MIRRFFGSLRGRSGVGDLDPVIRDHIDCETQDNIDRGMTAAEARRLALPKFGHVALVEEDTRRVGVWAWLDEARQDRLDHVPFRWIATTAGDGTRESRRAASAP